MRQTAYSIESRQLPEERALAVPAAQPSSEARERLLLVIEPDPASAALIRRGRRVADYLQGDCLAVCVGQAADLRHLGDEDRERLQRHLSFAQALQIETRVLEGADPADTLVTFARQQRVTQIFLLRQKDRTLRRWLTEGLVQQIVNLAQDMQVTVVADRSMRKRSA
jgi:two-component system sensor histidine kinase KdpD